MVHGGARDLLGDVLLNAKHPLESVRAALQGGYWVFSGSTAASKDWL